MWLQPWSVCISSAVPCWGSLVSSGKGGDGENSFREEGQLEQGVSGINRDAGHLATGCLCYNCLCVPQEPT